MRRRGVAFLVATILVAGCDKLLGTDDEHDAAPPPTRDAGTPTALDRLRAASSVAVHARTASDGRVLDVEGSFATTGATAQARAIGFLADHREAFGIDNAETQLEVVGTRSDELGTLVVAEGRVNVRIPVLFGEIRVHLDAAGRVVFVANELPADFRLRDYEPTVRSITARTTAEMLTGLSSDPERTTRTVVFPGAVLLDTDGRSSLGIVVRVGTGVRARDVVIHGDIGDLIASWPVAPSAEARETYVGEPDASPVLVVWQEGAQTRMACPPQVGCPGPGDTPVPPYCASGVCPQPLDAPPPSIRRVDLERALELHAHVASVCAELLRQLGRNGITESSPITRAYLAPGFDNAASLGQNDRGQPAIVVDPSLLSLDVVAHEIGHEIHRLEAAEVRQDLPASIYPGAVAEAMADLLASFVDTASPSVLGAGLGSHACGDVRDLDDPRRCGGPAHWRELRRPVPIAPCRDTSPRCDDGYGCVDGVGCYRDDGEVHHNSQIISRAFRLLVRQIPAAPPEVDVRIIGVEKVRAIWYRMLTRYLGPASGFHGVRSYARRACRELAEAGLHGIETRDCGALLNAFAAVGLGDEDWDEDSWSNLVDDCPRLYDPAQDGDCDLRDGGTPLPDVAVPPVPDASPPDLGRSDAGPPPIGGVHSCRVRTGELCTNLTGAGARADREAAREGCNPDISSYVEAPCPSAGSIGACTEWVGQIAEYQNVYYAPHFEPVETAASCAALPPPIGPGRWDSPYVAPP